VWEHLNKGAASRSKMSAGGSSGGGEKFCLKWNEFESNVSTAFRELRDDKDFFDVTLACEGNQLEAHKVILSACSPFFRSVLKRNPHSHPLLYLKGIKYENVLSVLNFMYHGEVNIAQDELNSFLAVAEDLQVKGLTQNGGAPSSNPPPKQPPEQPRPQKQQIRPSPAPSRPPYEPPQVQQQNDQMEVAEVVGSNIKTEPQQQVVDLGGDDESGVVEYGEEEEYQYGSQDYHYQEDLHQGMGDAGAAANYHGGANMKPDQEQLEFDEFVSQNTQKHTGGAKSIQCLLCSKVTIHVGNMKQHFEVHHFRRFYKCPVCHRDCKTRNCLSVHRKNYGH